MVGEKVEQVEAAEEVQEPMSFREALEKNMQGDEVAEIADKELATEERDVEMPKEQKFDANEYQKGKQPEAEKPKEPETKPAPPVLAPADMNPEEKAFFEKLTPEMQSYISRRAYETRSTLSREMQKIQGESKKFETLNNILSPHNEWMAQRELTPEAIVNRAISWDRAFEQDKLGTAMQYLQAQGVDIYELQEAIENGGQVQQQQVQPEQLDPATLKQQIMEELKAEQQKAAQAQNTEQMRSVVESFMKGQELFQDPNMASMLETEMAKIVPVYANSLPPEKALEKAFNVVTSDPDLPFKALIDAYGARERAEKAKQDAEKAKQSSRSVSGSLSGANPNNTQGLSFRDELRLRMSGGM